ncbi:hypothetical protein C6499_19220 [Candidatus Poribacteria bacterium]|nr:MAG: hypothetical protein C6499_19220 [Candidatus Poribacteria bacterium]
MHFRQKLTFMAFGSILTLAGYLLATLADDLTAQPETDNPTVFDKIVCRQLEVVDSLGTHLIELSPYRLKVVDAAQNQMELRSYSLEVVDAARNHVIQLGIGTNGSGASISIDDFGKNIVRIGPVIFKHSGEGGPRRAGWISVGAVGLGGSEYGGQIRIDDYTPGDPAIFGNMGEPPCVELGVDDKEQGFIRAWPSGDTWPEASETGE